VSRRRWLAVAVLAVLVAGCGSGAGNSPAPGNGSSNAPGWSLLDNGVSPHDFPSVAFTCHGTTGVYVSSFANDGATAGGSVFALAADPACRGGGQ